MRSSRSMHRPHPQEVTSREYPRGREGDPRDGRAEPSRNPSEKGSSKSGKSLINSSIFAALDDIFVRLRHGVAEPKRAERDAGTGESMRMDSPARILQ